MYKSYIAIDLFIPLSIKKSFFGFNKIDMEYFDDIDFFCFLLVKGQLKSKNDLIYYNNKENEGAIIAFDNYQLVDSKNPIEFLKYSVFKINLTAIDNFYDEIIIGANIYEAFKKKWTLLNSEVEFALVKSGTILPRHKIKINYKATYFEFCKFRKGNESWEMELYEGPNFQSINQAIKIRLNNE